MALGHPPSSHPPVWNKSLSLRSNLDWASKTRSLKADPTARVELQAKYTFSDARQAHPAPLKLAPCLHVLLIRNLHVTRSSWRNFLLFSLRVGQSSCCVITQKNGKRDTKAVQRELLSTTAATWYPWWLQVILLESQGCALNVIMSYFMATTLKQW